MAEPGTGFERSAETMGYSPVPGTDRVISDRIVRSPIAPAATQPGSNTELTALVRQGESELGAGNEAKAEEWFLKALAIADRAVGPDQTDLVLVINNLTRIYLKRSDYTAAEPLLLRLLDMKRSKGDDHPEVATVLATLAAVRQALGLHESGEQLWRRVVEIRERTLAPNHFAIATALEHLGDACAARGNFRDALDACQRAHTIRERTLGAEHPSLRSSRERIADLQLQASDDSLEYNAGVVGAAGNDNYRLYSGEPLTLSAPAPAPPIRERILPPPPAPSRKAKVLIPESVADRPLAPTAFQADPIPANLDAATEPVAAPYADVLESLREELDRPYESVGLAEKGSAMLAALAAFIGKRQVIASTVLVTIALLVTAVVTGARGWAETNQSAAVESSLPANEPVLTAPASSVGPTVRDPLAVSPSAQAPAPSKAVVQRPRVVEERSAPKKVAEQKSDTKKIAIPTFSSSRLDSVTSAAASSSSRATEALSYQPAPTPLGISQRSTFGDSEPSVSPQRAKLIGELPTPRIPTEAADVEGVVRVRFSVDALGRPVMSSFVVETSPNPLLTSAVRTVIPSIRFEPARSGGAESRAIADVVQVGFQFARRR
jgi:outer membrane biosynthesis protein TonB